MTEYSNALSDRLLVIRIGDTLHYRIYKKDNTLKWQSTTFATTKYPTELDGSIFSDTSIIRLLDDTVLAPLGQPDYTAYHSLSFGPLNSFTHLDSADFSLVYSTTEDTSWHPYLVNPTTLLDLDLLHNYVSRLGHLHALYFYVVQDTLTLLAWKDGAFQIANRYHVANDDEIFYFIMLILEQIELAPENLHFSMIGDKESHRRWHTLFANYVAPLHFTNDHGSGDGTEPILDFFVQCVL